MIFSATESSDQTKASVLMDTYAHTQRNSQRPVCDMQFTVVANESNRELRWQGTFRIVHNALDAIADFFPICNIGVRPNDAFLKRISVQLVDDFIFVYTVKVFQRICQIFFMVIRPFFSQLCLRYIAMNAIQNLRTEPFKLQPDLLHRSYAGVYPPYTTADKAAPRPQQKQAGNRKRKNVLPSNGQKRL